MGIGGKIKEYRIKSNMTQKDLADQLHVTNQAVSRWENDEAEPAFDTMRSMAALFGCTMNDFFEMESVAPEPIREVQVVERIVPQQTKQDLALCEKCNQPIYNTKDIHRFSTTIMQGRIRQTQNHLYCTECNDKRLAQEQRAAEQRRQEEIEVLKKRRLRSFIWSTVILAFILAIAIAIFCSGDIRSGVFTLVTAILAFCFSSCLFLKNNFMEDLWFDVFSWGIVRLPGVIMEFSLDGFLIGIVIKIVLAVLGFMLGVITALLATAIGLIISIFVYPFALIKNFKQVAGTVPFDNNQQSEN